MKKYSQYVHYDTSLAGRVEDMIDKDNMGKKGMSGYMYFICLPEKALRSFI
jgi:hypothetical protein